MATQGSIHGAIAPFYRSRAVRRALTGAVPAYGMFILLLAYYVIIDPSLISAYQVTNLVNLAVPLMIAALGQTVVILTGGVDLSLGAIIGIANCVAATTFTKESGAANMVHSIVQTLAVGLAAGLLNGALVAWGRLPAIIVTLATSSIWVGLSLSILPSPGGTVPEGFTTALTGNTGAIPNALFLLLPVAVAVWVVTQRTRSGRAIYAVGDGEAAAYMTGVTVLRAKVLAYALAGVLAAVAGLYLAALTSTGDPLVNQAYTLNSVAAVVIGGTSLMGGVGGIGGSIAGAGILAIVVSLLPFANIPSFWQTIFSGAILIAALALRSAISLLVRRV